MHSLSAFPPSGNLFMLDTLEAYEKERPSEGDACRIGDDRLIISDAWNGPTFTDDGIAEFDPHKMPQAKLPNGDAS